MWGLWATSINCSGFWIQAPNATCLSHEQYLALEVLLFCPFHATTQSSCFSCTGLVYRCPSRSSNPVQFLLVFLWSVPIDCILIQSFICGREGHSDFPPAPGWSFQLSPSLIQADGDETVILTLSHPPFNTPGRFLLPTVKKVQTR